METNYNYNYILLLGNKVSEIGDHLKVNSCLLEVCLDDTDDLGNINMVIDPENLKNDDTIGFGNAEDGYYIIKKIFQDKYDSIYHRFCLSEVKLEDFMKAYNEKLRYHCPEAFND